MSQSSQSDAGPPGQKVTDNEIIAAVEKASNELGLPVVTADRVSDYLVIQQQATKRRLEKLAEGERINQISVGRSKAWWTSDNPQGSIDPSAVDESLFDRIDVEDIPDRHVQEIAEAHDMREANPWAEMYRIGDTLIDVGAFLAIGGFMLLVAVVAGLSLLKFIPARPLGGFFFIIGFSLVALGIGFIGISYVPDAVEKIESKFGVHIPKWIESTFGIDIPYEFSR